MLYFNNMTDDIAAHSAILFPNTNRTVPNPNRIVPYPNRTVPHPYPDAFVFDRTVSY